MRFHVLMGMVVLFVLGNGMSTNRTAAEDKVDLKVGDQAPVFEGKDDTGKTWKSADHVGKKIVVVYFFPAAMTGG